MSLLLFMEVNSFVQKKFFSDANPYVITWSIYENKRTTLCGALLIATVMVSTSMVYSQTAFWKQINVPGSSDVNALAVNSKMDLQV
ncbi:MAG: hypothetical protein V1799_16370 [bacterium]